MKITRNEALVSGWFFAGFIVMIGAKVCGSDNALLIAGIYSLLSAKGCALAARYRVGGSYREWSPRTAFTMSFFPLSLVPFSLGCAAIVTDWKLNQLFVRIAGISAAFALAVLSYLLLARLARWSIHEKDG